VSTIAGGTAGWLDGAGTAARFNNPNGISVDAAGNLYVADTDNHRIRKIANDGLWTVSTIAGNGTSGSGDGTAAQFDEPRGVSVDAAGNLYVADTTNHRIRKIVEDPPGTFTVSTIAGSGATGYGNGGYADDIGNAARFNGPVGRTIDSSGNLYVGDAGNSRIRRIANDGPRTVSTVAGGTQGYFDAAGTAAQFNGPNGISIDAAGNLYVAERVNNRIRKIANDASRTVSTIAGDGTFGFADGIGTAAQFYNPIEITIDSLGNLYVADSGNHRIRRLSRQRVN
jgi:sugar lactone lactonase YvrE